MKVPFLTLTPELLKKHSSLNSVFRTIQKVRMSENPCKPDSISISSQDGILAPSTITVQPLTVFIHNFFPTLSINKLIYLSLIHI